MNALFDPSTTLGYLLANQGKRIMANSNLDFALNELDVSDEERDKALAEALSLIAERATISEWVKNPPEWFLSMYILEPSFALMRHRVAFERLEARPGYYKAIIPLLFHHMMIVGRLDDLIGYSDRWCFGDFPDALAAFQSWDGAPGTEPEGWHKHPMTGRLRKKQPDGSWRDYSG